MLGMFKGHVMKMYGPFLEHFGNMLIHVRKILKIATLNAFPGMRKGVVMRSLTADIFMDCITLCLQH